MLPSSKQKSEFKTVDELKIHNDYSEQRQRARRILGLKDSDTFPPADSAQKISKAASDISPEGVATADELDTMLAQAMKIACQEIGSATDVKALADQVRRKLVEQRQEHEEKLTDAQKAKNAVLAKYDQKIAQLAAGLAASGALPGDRFSIADLKEEKKAKEQLDEISDRASNFEKTDVIEDDKLNEAIDCEADKVQFGQESIDKLLNAYGGGNTLVEDKDRSDKVTFKVKSDGGAVYVVRRNYSGGDSRLAALTAADADKVVAHFESLPPSARKEASPKFLYERDIYGGSGESFEKFRDAKEDNIITLSAAFARAGKKYEATGEVTPGSPAAEAIKIHHLVVESLNKEHPDPSEILRRVVGGMAAPKYRAEVGKFPEWIAKSVPPAYIAKQPPVINEFNEMFAAIGGLKKFYESLKEDKDKKLFMEALYRSDPEYQKKFLEEYRTEAIEAGRKSEASKNAESTLLEQAKAEVKEPREGLPIQALLDAKQALDKSGDTTRKWLTEAFEQKKKECAATVEKLQTQTKAEIETQKATMQRVTEVEAKLAAENKKLEELGSAAVRLEKTRGEIPVDDKERDNKITGINRALINNTKEQQDCKAKIQELKFQLNPAESKSACDDKLKKLDAKLQNLQSLATAVSDVKPKLKLTPDDPQIKYADTLYDYLKGLDDQQALYAFQPNREEMLKAYKQDVATGIFQVVQQRYLEEYKQELDAAELARMPLKDTTAKQRVEEIQKKVKQELSDVDNQHKILVANPKIAEQAKINAYRRAATYYAAGVPGPNVLGRIEQRLKEDLRQQTLDTSILIVPSAAVTPSAPPAPSASSSTSSSTPSAPPVDEEEYLNSAKNALSMNSLAPGNTG